jgi:hypothetical protein
MNGRGAGQPQVLADGIARATVLPMQDLGKLLVIGGAVLIVLGAVLWKFGGFGPLGRLPGDISVQKESFSFHFPIVTCLLISLLLTAIMWLFRR